MKKSLELNLLVQCTVDCLMMLLLDYQKGNIDIKKLRDNIYYKFQFLSEVENKIKDKKLLASIVNIRKSYTELL